MRPRIVLVVVVVGLALSACSSAAERAAARTRRELSTASALNLVSAARLAAATRPDVSVDATTTSATGPSTSVHIDFTGKDAAGTLETGGVVVQLSRVSDYDFVAGPDAFWRTFLAGENADLVPRLHAKWVSFTDKSNTFGKLARLLNRQDFIGTYVNVSKNAARAGDAKVAGIDCYIVKDAAGTLYVAKDDGRPIKVVDSSGGVVTYRYDKIPTPTPPLDKDLVLDGSLGLY